MKIIISPAKKMEECQDIFAPGDFPEYLNRTEVIFEKLRAMSETELQRIFIANDQITHQNFERYHAMELKKAQSPALLTYVGIQYQYMAPKLFTYAQWEYVKEHLRILSGFYGILRPDDRVTPYRLEMQAKLDADGAKDLYEFWGHSLYEAVVRSTRPDGIGRTEICETGIAACTNARNVILNLASREYSKAIGPYLTENDRYVTCIFGIRQNGKVKVKATEAKMARGEMVRFMSEKNILDIEQIKTFDRLGYRYSETDSCEDTFVYIK